MSLAEGMPTPKGLSFRCGKMLRDGGMVRPDPRKGRLRISVLPEEGLTRVQWFERTHEVEHGLGQPEAEDEYIVFPGQGSFRRVDKVQDARVYVLEIKEFDSSSESVLFWMQEPDPEQDKQLFEQANQLLSSVLSYGHGPALESSTAQGTSVSSASSVPSSSSSSSSSSSGPATVVPAPASSSSSATASATAPALPVVSGSSHFNLQFDAAFENALQQATAAAAAGSGPHTSKRSRAAPVKLSLMDILRKVDFPHLRKDEPAALAELEREHLPPGDTIEETVRSSVPFHRAVGVLQYALSQNYEEVIQLLGLSPSHSSARNHVEALVQAIQNSASKKNGNGSSSGNNADRKS